MTYMQIWYSLIKTLSYSWFEKKIIRDFFSKMYTHEVHLKKNLYFKGRLRAYVRWFIYHILFGVASLDQRHKHAVSVRYRMNSLLTSVHSSLPPEDPGAALVRGDYLYYHYGCDGVDDRVSLPVSLLLLFTSLHACGKHKQYKLVIELSPCLWQITLKGAKN